MGNSVLTILFDDKVMYEYESATQVMDSDFETQMANLDDETQVVNLDAEFEEMDAFDETQLFNEYDTEEVVVSDHERLYGRYKRIQAKNRLWKE
ncbi:hypothetical protein E3N88_34766 [Mikania micrantha]|uniref:Uncharacterized protein n=1 Tax=Mikania micrantha TaxID=192012 RepID=A0A5N6LZX5_9ASTR|nr:hypothetical protein E3N88_34766 [Mikania micrantha]